MIVSIKRIIHYSHLNDCYLPGYTFCVQERELPSSLFTVSDGLFHPKDECVKGKHDDRYQTKSFVNVNYKMEMISIVTIPYLFHVSRLRVDYAFK